MVYVENVSLDILCINRDALSVKYFTDVNHLLRMAEAAALVNFFSRQKMVRA